MRTVIVDDNAILTTNYDNNKKSVPVHPGPLSFGINYDKQGSTSLDIRIEFGWPKAAGSVPLAGVDSDWYPSATQVGAVDNTLAVTTNGRSFIDLVGRLPSATAQQVGFAGHVPGGATHARISVKLTGNTDNVKATLTFFHNGPAHATFTPGLSRVISEDVEITELVVAVLA
jgi:hypothetical protein